MLTLRNVTVKSSMDLGLTQHNYYLYKAILLSKTVLDVCKIYKIYVNSCCPGIMPFIQAHTDAIFK